MLRTPPIHKSTADRSGFTLTELLIVLSIIGVLTSSFAFAIRGAQERARAYRTESQLTRIENILQAQLLEVLNERSVIPLPPVGNAAGSLGPHPATIGATASNTNYVAQGEGLYIRTRRYHEEALRVMLLSRFPYQADHLTFNSPMPDLYLRGLPVAANGTPVVPYYTSAAANAAAAAPEASAPDTFRPAASTPSWLARYRNAMWVDSATGAPQPNPTLQTPLDPSPAAVRTTSSELLYLVLQRIWVDGQPATALFRESEFGDTDGDGALEVLDAWGEPIGYRLQIAVSDSNMIYNFSLSDYSAWMTDFVDSFGVNHFVQDFSPDSMTVSRAKVVAYSGSIEDVDSINAAAVSW